MVAGSVSSVTRGQIDRLLQDGYQLVEIEVSEYLPWREAQALPLLAQLEERLSQGQKLVIASGYQPEAVERAKQAGAKLGLGAVQVSELIAQMLGWLGANLLNKQEVTGVVLTGGDTAVAVCRALGVTGIHILEEIAPGIPLGLMTTNGGKTLKVVTKAGAFGNPDALVKASHKLQQRM
ncbi:D-threonate kinase [bioreactor metagenome]|uniref:D-threonate kinase n=1 Tax=bioreactor metagenome TaxID=1076179 RepID=A0A645I9X8_9ZZZZ